MAVNLEQLEAGMEALMVRHGLKEVVLIVLDDGGLLCNGIGEGPVHTASVRVIMDAVGRVLNDPETSRRAKAAMDRAARRSNGGGG